jgi:hypothetical protein
MELVKQFEDHKRFLFEIFETKNAKWAAKQKELKEQKVARIKQRWIAEVM